MEKAQINEFIEQHKEEAIALLEELGKIPAPRTVIEMGKTLV